jgi:hypothetical protein
MVIGVEPCCFGVRLENERFWTRHIARGREASLYGERESTSSVIQVEELHRP